MVAQQGNVLEFPENKGKAEPSGESKGAQSQGPSSPGASSIPTPIANPGGTGSGPSPWGHGVEITRAGGNVARNHVSNVTNNRDSGNTYTNSVVSTVNNNITIAVARHKRRRSRNRQRWCGRRCKDLTCAPFFEYQLAGYFKYTAQAHDASDHPRKLVTSCRGLFVALKQGFLSGGSQQKQQPSLSYLIQPFSRSSTHNKLGMRSIRSTLLLIANHPESVTP